jgi:hypothetical protein
MKFACAPCGHSEIFFHGAAYRCLSNRKHDRREDYAEILSLLLESQHGKKRVLTVWGRLPVSSAAGSSTRISKVAEGPHLCIQWRGQNLSYTIACITVMLVSLLWFIGSHAASNPDTRTEKYHAPSDG